MNCNVSFLGFGSARLTELNPRFRKWVVNETFAKEDMYNWMWQLEEIGTKTHASLTWGRKRGPPCSFCSSSIGIPQILKLLSFFFSVQDVQDVKEPLIARFFWLPRRYAFESILMMKNQTLSYLWKTIFFSSFYVVPKPKEDDIIVWVKKRNICDPYVLNAILTHDHKHDIFFLFLWGGGGGVHTRSI